ncbi:uncharacterized protein [Cherax quadricarinatus]|uniref:uncharacterized protein n=1 Tax=Cherax quadricarinatus TaxID=27406 RepID=UPI00387E9E91
MALNSVLKVVTIWLVGFTHLTSGHKNDSKSNAYIIQYNFLHLIAEPVQPISSTSAPPTSPLNYNIILTAGVVLFLIAVAASVYGFITRYRYQQLLLQKDPITDPETRDNEYEEWNEKWKMQPVTSGSNEEHSSDISPLKVIQRPGSAHDSENSLYGVI